MTPSNGSSKLAVLLRGERGASRILATYDEAELCRDAEHHGVLTLLADRLIGHVNLSASLQTLLEEASRRTVAADLLRESELHLLIEELDGRGVRPLLFKGAHLAYSHYSRSDLRPRLDTDILIPSAARQTTDEVMTRLGYERSGHVTGTLVMYQATYIKHRDGMPVHVVDLHWKIANPQLFADLFSYDELAASSVPLARLSVSARGLSDLHALIIAAVHRVAHHFNSDHLIWLYDIHLLASSLDPASWPRVVDLAEQRGVATVCRQGLDRARDEFHTAFPDDVWPHHLLGRSTTDVATARYLEPDRLPVQNLMADLRALRSWGARGRLIREHLFPPARYMREVYAPASTAPLTVLYARRVLRGARKWLVHADRV